MPPLKRYELLSVWPPLSSATTGFLPYMPFAFSPATTPGPCRTPTRRPVERDVDRRGAALDLAIVLDDLRTAVAAAFSIAIDEPASSERG